MDYQPLLPAKQNFLTVMKIKIAVIAALLITTSCVHTAPPKDYSQFDTTEQSGISFRLETYQYNEGWAYDILVDGKKLIAQKHIPVVEGNKLFVSQKDAYNCGKLMIIKLISGEMPPSITDKDLIDLNITYKQ